MPFGFQSNRRAENRTKVAPGQSLTFDSARTLKVGCGRRLGRASITFASMVCWVLRSYLCWALCVLFVAGFWVVFFGVLADFWVARPGEFFSMFGGREKPLFKWTAAGKPLP